MLPVVRTKLVLMAWVAAIVVLAWPVKLGGDSSDPGLPCGAAGMAFVDGLRADDNQFPPLDQVCGDEAYPHVAVAAGLTIGAPLLAILGWRDRRRRRRVAKRHDRDVQAAAKAAADRQGAAQRPISPER